MKADPPAPIWSAPLRTIEAMPLQTARTVARIGPPAVKDTTAP